MRQLSFTLVVLQIVLLFHTFTIAQHPVTYNKQDSLLIRAAVIRTGTAFNQQLPDTILSFYSKEILVSFPGVPDTKYRDFAAAFNKMMSDTTVKRITKDSIEEIIVSGDMAVVRVNWITTTIQQSPPGQTTRIARDLQVWRKEQDGDWKFFRGMWFREPPVKSKDK